MSVRDGRGARLGLFADVHGNAPALDAVLGAFAGLAVDGLLSAGDLVGYNAAADEVVERFVAEGIPSVAGNHDRMAVDPGTRGGNDLVLRTLAVTDGVLRRPHLDYLASLPVEWRGVRSGRTVLAVHGTPDDPLGGYYYPGDEVRLPEGVDVLVLGQTHRRLAERPPGGLVVNPGGVGLPRDGDPRPSLAVLDLEALTVEHHRVLYDCSPLAVRNAELGVPSVVNDRLFFGAATDASVALDGGDVFDAAADRFRGEGRRIVRHRAGLWVEVAGPEGGAPVLVMAGVLDDGTMLVRTTPVGAGGRWEEAAAEPFVVRRGTDGALLELRTDGRAAPARLAGLVEAAEAALKGVGA